MRLDVIRETLMVLAMGMLNAAVAAQDRPGITIHPEFQDACLSFAARPDIGRVLIQQSGTTAHRCDDAHDPLVVSITHENEQNNHKGAANYDPAITSYTRDFNP